MADTPWETVADIAREHLLESSLWAGLSSFDAQKVPAEVAKNLRWSHRRTLLTNVRFRNQLLSAVATLNNVGCSPVLLKGAEFLLDGTFGLPSHRAMHDLDLLVRREDLGLAVRTLRRIGYEERWARTMQSYHELSLCKVGEPGLLDLHFELGERTVTKVLPTAEILMRSTERQESGVIYRSLAPNDLVLHRLLESELQDLNYVVAGISLRQLYTYKVVVQKLRGDVDWRLVGNRLSAAGLGRVQAAHAHLLRKLFAIQLGPEVSIAARAHYYRCLAGFGLRWPPDLERNLRFAFDPVYMRHRYPGDSLTAARLRHVRRLWHQRGHGVFQDAFHMRGR